MQVVMGAHQTEFMFWTTESIIAKGNPYEIQNNQRVIEAYLWMKMLR